MRVYLFAMTVLLATPTLGYTEGETKAAGAEKVRQVDGVHVAFELNPHHPSSGQRATARLRLADENNRPVAARKLKVRWAMPEMGHDVETKSAVPAREKGAYTTTIRFPMGGRYTATVSGEHDGRSFEATFDYHVMEPAGKVKEAGHGKHAH